MPDQDFTQNKGFNSLVNARIVADVLNAPSEDCGVERRLAPILLVQANSDPLHELPRILATLMEETAAAHYFIDFQFANLIFARTAPAFKNAKPPLDVTIFWNQLMAKAPNGARAIYGEADCLLGTLGSRGRSVFGAFMIRPEDYVCAAAGNDAPGGHGRAAGGVRRCATGA